MNDTVSIRDAVKAAQFVAELVRQGIKFHVTECDGVFLIRLTGGY